MPRRKRASDTIVGRLKAADPFELIRWLARSQPDPRKALAELVQNSIDAGARQIRITRLREHGVTTLRIVDDGEGVIPELERTEALTYIATHIGHSRKRNLTPEQRRELMLQGKYGIGLLGFWSIGQVLEMRTQMPGQPAYVLRMHEDQPKFEIERARGRLSLEDRATEIVIRGLHRPAFLSLSARRMSDYLAAELRGQLLSRPLQILVHDRIARGRAPKVLEVVPERFEGARLALPGEVPTDGFTPLRIELYLLPDGSTPGQVAISCAGTTVYDDVAHYEVADLRHSPWTDARLTGLLEFPDFQVAPGSRRGVLPDRAALAFVTALRSLEPAIREQLAVEETRAASALDAEVLRQLERAFRDLNRLAPEYDFFDVRAAGTEPIGDGAAGRGEGPGSGAAAELGEGAAMPVVAEGEAEGESEEEPTLLPAGPLKTLQIVPASTRVERLGQRRLRAIARDAMGARIVREVGIRWWIDSALGVLEKSEGPMTVFRAGPATGEVAIHAEAREGERTVAAQSTIAVVDASELEGSAKRTGIPEPAFVDEPAGDWRSRMRDGRWEVNSGHRDYKVAAETARRKLRYLAALLSKEIVLHSFPQPQLAPALERLVEVLTIADRRLER